jgi:hypothetical protein
MPRLRKKAARKGSSEPQPRWWRLGTTWTFTHFATGYVVATVALGSLFLVTAVIGTVTKDDIAAAGMVRATKVRDQVFYFREPLRTQMLPVFFEISKTSEPRLVCGIVPEDAIVNVNIRISNRFGKTMQGVLNSLQWVLGLFYEIHFPTTLQATAKEVLDPNFGQRLLDMQDMQPADIFIKQRKAMFDPSCEAEVLALLKSSPSALVCPATRFLRSPDQQEILAVGILTRCVTLAGESEGRSLQDFKGEDHTPWLTKMKIKLGILHAEIDQKRRL